MSLHLTDANDEKGSIYETCTNWKILTDEIYDIIKVFCATMIDRTDRLWEAAELEFIQVHSCKKQLVLCEE